MTVEVDTREGFLIAALHAKARAKELRAGERRGQGRQTLPRTRIFTSAVPLLVCQIVGDTAMWVAAEARAARLVAPGALELLVALPGASPGTLQWVPREHARLFARKT